ncbi:hypothetical protein BJY14_004405 [Actinomadura luteofluorescens]|uniref:Uncharacterized protein n=1 Tax=Actinomadura luteofluorescens TaxID=46163 RepID=A0A7Y9EIP7_9ACTN|nr:hypothetical protein [Actinomadura luteofluorescens]NYD48422.1 hypothetical protein [Actinomadura luteofluorescens]
MRSPFADRREDILPRSLADLLAAETPRTGDEAPRRRRPRPMTVRRVTSSP